jgi:methylmalonyl-CoA/ethylmalonyl-CoA epimerase
VSELRFHHLGVAVRDLAGPIDDAIQGVRACFVGSGAPGEVTYELVAPLPGAARSPLDRVLEKGNTSYHVCYETPDLDAALARFVDEGAVLVSGPVPAVAFEGRRIAWVLLPLRHLLELLEAPPPPGARV